VRVALEEDPEALEVLVLKGPKQEVMLPKEPELVSRNPPHQGELEEME